MRIKLYQRVALTKDLPEYDLHKGDVAVVVETYLQPQPAKEKMDMPLKCSTLLERQWR